MNKILRERVIKISGFVVLLFFMLCTTLQGQMNKLPFKDSTQNLSSPLIITAPDNTLLSFYYAGSVIYLSRSNNNGSDWTKPVTFSPYPVSTSHNYITGIITKTGRILIIFRSYDYGYYLKTYSDDNGLTWSSPQQLVFVNYISGSNYPVGANLSQSASGKILFIFNSENKGIFQSSSNDNGASFNSPLRINPIGSYGSIALLDSTKLLLVYQNSGIFSLLSTNDGGTWGTMVSIDTNSTSIFNPHVIKDSTGVVWLFYQKNIQTLYPGITQTDIVYRQSTDNGSSWNSPVNFTKFLGYDGDFNLSIKGNNPLVSFTSDRGNSKLSLWYGLAGLTEDLNTPPYLYKTSISVNSPSAGQQFNFSANADCYNNISSVELFRNINGTDLTPIPMYDDGTHGDTTAEDNIFTCVVPGLSSGELMQTTIKITDQAFNSGLYKGLSTSIMFNSGVDSVMIDVNRFKLPLDNTGTLADKLVGNETMAGGKYDGNITLYSGGFYMSGISNGFMWSNGSFTASRIDDYVPGKVGSVTNDPKNILYVVKSTDPPFGQAWQNWRVAVSQGADFYDGDHDGIYNPIDLNGNGKWDPNEDRPDLLGDMTAWCVYNDGVPSTQRVFTDVNPQGIEVQQTVFAQKDSADLNNVIFVRYRLINRGTVSNVMDSVYFGPVNDIDIGDNGAEDLAGSDTLLNTGYMYHINNSTKWGYNPPAETVTFLQGPLTYISGITFNDINGNGIFDQGIDTPIDTAYSFKGPLIGKTIYPGAKNLGISSILQYYGGIDPGTRFQLRNYLLGKDITGNYINPCTWTQGQVLGGIKCSVVNPVFMYSGDPILQKGWIDVVGRDQRIIVSSGPFQLLENKPVDIIAAYIVGRGSDGINSLQISKDYAANTIKYYNSNFPKSILSGIQDLPNTITNFQLYQNYPNPFNPTTRIRYSVKTKSLVSLKVYNILGEEAAVLLNEERNPGEYELNFNAVKYNLASGVYFYRLTAGGFTLVKKMVLIK